MKTLVVGATKAELKYFYQYYNLPEVDFIETKLFDVLITGVGMVATAFMLGKHLNSSKYKLVLNLGVAGCFDLRMELGSLVDITEDIFAEFGAENGEEFLTISDLGFGESRYFSTSDLENNLPKAKSITVNRVTGSEKTIKSLVARFDPLTESMEGAAVFYACKLEQVDCLQIRAISNYVEVRNKDNWDIKLAIKNLNAWAIAFFKVENW